MSTVQALLGHLDRKLGHLERQQHQLMDASLGVKVSSIWFYLAFSCYHLFPSVFLYQLLKTVVLICQQRQRKEFLNIFSKHFYPFEGELDAAEWGTNSLDEKVDKENRRLQQQQPRCTMRRRGQCKITWLPYQLYLSLPGFSFVKKTQQGNLLCKIQNGF